MGRSLSIEDVARRLMVRPSDVVSWINQEKLRSVEDENGSQCIDETEYARFGSSFPKEYRETLGQYLWNSLDEIQEKVHSDVNKRFNASNEKFLKNDEKSIAILEELHRKYEHQIDVFQRKDGYTAAFILYARIISLEYAMINMLRANQLEAFLLFRLLWEAILLAEYFALSEHFGDNSRCIRRWFFNDESPGAGEVRHYLSRKMNLSIERLKKLHNLYSKPVHHTYHSIMEFYRGYSMSGFLGKHSKRLGFDYKKSSTTKDILELLLLFEELIQASLQGFYICFAYTIPLNTEEKNSLLSLVEFYDLDVSARTDIILKQ